MIAAVTVLAYLAAGGLFTLACVPSFRADARAIRARGQRPELGRAAFKALLFWPLYLFHRGTLGRWAGQKYRALWRYHRPDYDHIAELESENRIE